MTPLPDSCTQLSLDLFPAPSFESILALRNIPDVTVAFSSRLRRGWYLNMTKSSGIRRLVVPAYFENAPHEVKTALIDWGVLFHNHRGRDRTAFSRKKELERYVYRYIESLGVATPKASRFDPCSCESRGCKYDLTEVFDALNGVYFNAELSSYVRWGKSAFRSYQSNKYDHKGVRHSLITIGTMYNRPDVPRYAIESIMFHEMLHIVVPPVKRNGRAVIHGADFKRRERSFPFHLQWLAWEKTALKRAR